MKAKELKQAHKRELVDTNVVWFPPFLLSSSFLCVFLMGLIISISASLLDLQHPRSDL
jgi:hypothetical protein